MFAPQLHVLHSGLDIPSIEYFTPAKNDPSFGIKPKGGLWTSTYDARLGSDWVQWCMSEQFRVPDDGLWDCAVLFPHEDVKVVCIDNLNDLKNLVASYGLPSPIKSFAFLDFEKIAKDYDGVWLTREGQWATRFSQPGLYGWDCESTIWLKWVFRSVNCLGRVSFSNETGVACDA